MAGRTQHLPWSREVRSKLTAGLAPLLGLIPRGRVHPRLPEPHPRPPTPDLTAELAALRAIPDEVIRSTLTNGTVVSADFDVALAPTGTGP
ncbi:hypothetical protein HCN51_43635 [Nonomuraea sp. FMUSA5-5]|uniref:Uncharacterized protein n=1 Tax=Nonomuraea composti TaxID=2720023 RepID=A0ABX1BID6_9ACTN|nr:hypothetical protein [Nonomuraea sp. FMUSA5-5]NJP96254.1 hypothetical protein [Nonomuraea sp. FMUSA5-5]